MRNLTYAFSFCFFALPLPRTASAHSICVDAGHGGSDPGALGCGLEEEDVNLDTALRLRTELQNAGFTVYMTRTSDTTVSLSSRVSYANSKGVDRFVSIHSNSAAQVASGIETFCYPYVSSTTIAMRDQIQAEMVDAWPLPNRGGKTADFHVLRETTMPATLTELGFINNCSVDAQYLSSPTHRQSGAYAHRRALQLHFGITPSDSSILKGVVYEGSDLEARLPGATVTILQTGATVTAGSGDALWSFELPPATYTVQASLSGYTTEQRSCTVQSGATIWCSVGLNVVVANGLLTGMVYEDRGDDDTSTRLAGATVTIVNTGDTTTALGTSASWQFTLAPGTYTVRGSLSGYLDCEQECEVVNGEERSCSLGLAPAASDPEDPEDPTPHDEPTADPTQEPNNKEASPETSHGCGGEAKQAGVGLGLLWLLSLWLGTAVRRRWVAPLLPLAVLCLATGAARAETPVMAEPGLPFAHLTSIEVVAAGDYRAPVLAPSGKAVLFSGPKLKGLLLLPLPAGEVRQLSDLPRAGYRPVWQAGEQRVALGGVGHAAKRLPSLVIDLQGRFSTSSAAHPTVTVTQTEDDTIVLQKNGERRVISEGAEPFFAPLLSPNGQYVAYNGLYSGLYVYRVVDGIIAHLGAGDHPAFSPTSAYLVFDRTSDDGERLTSGDIYITDLNHPVFATAPLTHTPDRIEQFPSLAEEGRLLAFSAEGRIYTATVVMGH